MFNAQRGKSPENPKAKKLQQLLLESFNRRLSSLKHSPDLLTATILDPRFKNKYLSEDDVEICIMELENFSSIFSESNDSNTTSEETLNSASLEEDLWGSHDKMTLSQNVKKTKKKNLILLQN